MDKHKLHDLKGEQKNQLLQLVDKSGNVIGEGTREEAHKGLGKPHLAFMSFLFNEKGEMVLTQRSHTKSLWGLYWDSAIVSHILKGESPELASNRRGKEELGVDVIFKDIGAFYYTLKYKEDSENEYCHVLVGQTNEIIIANPVEIEDVKVLKMDEVKKFYESEKDKFTPWFKIAWEKFGTDIEKYV